MNSVSYRAQVLRILFAIVVTILLPLGSYATSDTSETWTVVTLNTWWLFDGINEQDFDQAPQTPGDAEHHLTAIADYLRTVDAEFIALQEVEDAAMLHRLNVKLGGIYHEVFVQGTDDYTGQDVAALSRFPILDMGRTNDAQAYPIPGSRFRGPRGVEEAHKNLWVTVDAGFDAPLTFVVVHLLANPNDLERVVRREAQAMIIRTLALRFFEREHHLVLLGDINDFDGLTCDAADNQPRSCVHTLFRDLDPARNGEELVHVADRLDPSDRYTYWYDENRNGIDDGPQEHSMIDHIYVTQRLAERLTEVRIDHAAYDARTVSDHWPLIAVFQHP